MHITLYDSTTSGFVFYQNKKHFIFQTEQKVIQNQSILLIDRLTGKSEQITQKIFFEIIKQQSYTKSNVWAIYGMIFVEQSPYLALVKQVKKVSTFRQNHIFQIKDLTFISFDPRKQENIPQQDKKILEFIRSEIVNQKFYFSYTEDMTVSFRRKMRKVNDESPQSKFFWNQKAVQFLSSNGINKPWIIPIIQGYVGGISDKNLHYRIISRRSKHMSGTRYNNRGINLQGFASNFIQTQQRIEYENLIFSHLTLRGSVPVYWKQQNGSTTIQFPYKQQKDFRGLKKHYQNLVQDYQCSINTVNLLSEGKPHQKCLTQRFVKNLQKNGNNFYFNFDFNNCVQTLHSNIDEFIQKYESNQSINNFQCYDYVKDKKLNQQNFIPRINCLDCVDRTNVICCRIGEKFVNKVFKKLNFSITQDFHQKYLENWASLGNKVSLIYCGTSSVAEHLTLKQEESYWDLMTSSIRSINRYINASLSDAFKQECNSILLHEHKKSSTTYFVDNIARNHIKPAQYCTFFDIMATFITWNVGAMNCDEFIEAEKMIFAQKIFGKSNQKTPQIVFITLQEIVQLSSYNVVTNDNLKPKKEWEQIFFSILNNYSPKNQGFTYCLYFSQALVGITSFLFVKNSLNPKVDILNQIRKIFNYEIKRGYGGNFGNKGSIVSGFYVFDTIIINFASHLAAGDQKRQQRLQDVKGILESLNLQKNTQKANDLSDYVFFTGDMNFRLGATDQETRKLIDEAKKNQFSSQNKPASIAAKNNKLKELFEQDQLNEVYNKQTCLKNFTEEQIKFYPTYRYVKNSTVHDEKRKPGWCDRIFYKQGQKNTLKCLSYTSIDEVTASDHRAVVGEFSMRIRQQNKQKKQELTNSYLKSANQKSSIQQPKYLFPKTRYNY